MSIKKGQKYAAFGIACLLAWSCSQNDSASFQKSKLSGLIADISNYTAPQPAPLSPSTETDTSTDSSVSMSAVLQGTDVSTNTLLGPSLNDPHVLIVTGKSGVGQVLVQNTSDDLSLNATNLDALASTDAAINELAGVTILTSVGVIQNSGIGVVDADGNPFGGGTSADDHQYNPGALVGDVCPADLEGSPYANSGFSDGSVQAPYIICTPAQLYNLMTQPWDWNFHFVLALDVSMAAYDGSLPELSLTPIGSEANPFAGTFDGQNKKISDLKFSGPGMPSSKIGLFGSLAGASVENLSIENLHYDLPDAKTVGGLVGFMDNHSSLQKIKIHNLHINAKSEIGGLVGMSNGTIVDAAIDSVAINCSGNIAGGLVGRNDGSIAASVASNVDLSGLALIGGFAGLNQGPIQYAYASGSVSGLAIIGSFVGENDNSISQAITSVSLSAQSPVYIGSFSGFGLSDSYSACFMLSDLIDPSLQLNLSAVGSNPGSNSEIHSVSSLEFLGDQSALDGNAWSFSPSSLPQLLWLSSP